MLPVPTSAQLAAFAGQPTDYFGGFATQALTQATLLFGLKTGLTELPDDPDLAQLATFAILQMAERIYYEQPYVAQTASPLQSETIGSYSYTKTSQIISRYGKATEDTGLFWWDLALEQLTATDYLLTESGLIDPELSVLAQSGTDPNVYTLVTDASQLSDGTTSSGATAL